MDFGISQEGFCYARFGAEKHGFAVRSAAMRHRMHPLLSAPTGGSSHYRARGRYLWRKEARLCRAECPPHFLFVLPKRKRAGHGTKEKALRDELPGKAVNSPKTGTGRHELPTELETPLPAALYLNLKSVRRRICGHGAQRGANRTPSASLSAAAPAHLQSRVVRSEAERTGVEIRRFGFPPRCAPPPQMRGYADLRFGYSAAGRRLPDFVGSA